MQTAHDNGVDGSGEIQIPAQEARKHAWALLYLERGRYSQLMQPRAVDEAAHGGIKPAQATPPSVPSMPRMNNISHRGHHRSFWQLLRPHDGLART